MLRASLEFADGRREEVTVSHGQLKLIPLPDGDSVNAVLRPERSFDVGAGKGRERTATLRGGVVGLMIDGRGRRPFALPEDRARRIAKLNEWNDALGIYPAAVRS